MCLHLPSLMRERTHWKRRERHLSILCCSRVFHSWNQECFRRLVFISNTDTQMLSKPLRKSAIYTEETLEKSVLVDIIIFIFVIYVNNAQIKCKNIVLKKNKKHNGHKNRLNFLANINNII